MVRPRWADSRNARTAPRTFAPEVRRFYRAGIRLCRGACPWGFPFSIPRSTMSKFHAQIIHPSLALVLASFGTALAADPVPTAPPVTAVDEVVVTASPLGRTLFEQAQPVSVLTDQALQLQLQPTLGETLSSTPGVRSTYYGPAASRPVTRGLDADRIRILQNGVNTIDASATSQDHAVSLDPVSVESIEVVRGPATLLYGANAIGGVVNVIDNRIPDERIDVPLRGSLGGRYSSADDGLSRDIMLEGGIGGLNYHLEGYRREVQDVHIPGFARSERLRGLKPLDAGEKEEIDVLGNSFLTTQGFSAGPSYVWDKGYFGLAYSGFESNYGSVAEKGVSIDMEQRRWDFQGAFNEPFAGIKAIKYKFALSDYDHTEFEDGAPGTTFKNKGYDGRIEVTHERIGPLEGAFGYQTQRSDFSAIGDEKFLPQVITETHSAFVFEELAFNERWKLQGGLRYDHTTANAAADKDIGPARSRTFNDVSGSLGVVFTPSDDYTLALSTSWSERAPTHQELYANGPHMATGAFEIGDDSLPVEQALGFDLSLRKRTGFVTGSATVFYNRFQNFIGQFPTGESRQLEDEELLVYAYRSSDAEFFGGELEATFHLLKPVTAPEPAAAGSKNPKQPVSPVGVSGPQDVLDLELKADFVHAKDTISGDPLPRISPFHVSAALDYHRGDFGSRIEGVFSGPQHRTADNELPTDGYFMLSASVSYTIRTRGVSTDVYVKGVNLTNEEAREHTSFLKDIAPLAGRGIVVGMKINF